MEAATSAPRTELREQPGRLPAAAAGGEIAAYYRRQAERAACICASTFSASMISQLDVHLSRPALTLFLQPAITYNLSQIVFRKARCSRFSDTHSKTLSVF